MPTMQQDWLVPFVTRLRLHTRMSSREALLVASRLYEQWSCLDGARAADRVVELGKIRRSDLVDSLLGHPRESGGRAERGAADASGA